LSLIGLTKTRKIKKYFSLTPSLQFDNFIARGQRRENKNLVFFPTALLKRKKENPTHKARVIKATQPTSQPKLSLHMLSAFAHIRNYTLFYRLFIKIFCHSNKSIVTLKLEHENVRIRSLNNICSVSYYSFSRKLVNFIHARIISRTPETAWSVLFAWKVYQYLLSEYCTVPRLFFN